MELKVGDIIKYGTYSTDSFIDEICCKKIKKKTFYYGVFEQNNAESMKKNSLKELLEDYKETWEFVSIIRGDEEFVLKTFDTIIKSSYIVFEKVVDSKIIKIIHNNKKAYYTEYEGDNLIFYKVLNL